MRLTPELSLCLLLSFMPGFCLIADDSNDKVLDTVIDGSDFIVKAEVADIIFQENPRGGTTAVVEVEVAERFLIDWNRISKNIDFLYSKYMPALFEKGKVLLQVESIDYLDNEPLLTVGDEYLFFLNVESVATFRSSTSIVPFLRWSPVVDATVRPKLEKLSLECPNALKGSVEKDPFQHNTGNQ